MAERRLALEVWLAPGLVCDPVAWHRQELVLGVAGAAMAGYLMTALPHWTAGPGVGPGLARGLVLAWALGRALGLPCLPDALALAGLVLFPLGLTAALVLPVIAARTWGRLPMALAPLLLVGITVRLRLEGDGLTAALGMAMLVALVGGRIIPAFLRARAGGDTTTRLTVPVAARGADVVLALALAAHLAGLAPPPLTGLSLGFAAGLPLPTALHALTMGLMGSMILAIMARAWARRVPGTLRLGPVMALALAFLQLATLLRLFQSDPGLAALCWSAGWALASAVALAALFRPVPHPVLSARRPPLAP